MRCHNKVDPDGAPYQIMSSSTSFVSSTGACRLIGMHEKREDFLVVSIDAVLLNSASGQGEYINALAELSGCNDEATRKKFGTVVRNHFEEIYFDRTGVATPEKIGPRIDQMISRDPDLQNNCAITS